MKKMGHSGIGDGFSGGGVFSAFHLGSLVSTVASSGNDMLIGTTSDDTLSGGAGNDRYTVNSAGDKIVENASEGADSVFATVSYTLDDNVENLTIGGSDGIYGNGNAMDNVIIGNEAANVLDGKEGNDTISGGGGADTLTGGSGLDVFVIEIRGASGEFDTITDFSSTDDTIQLGGRHIHNASISAVTISSDYFVANATGAAVDSNDYVIYNTETGALYFDMDGSGSIAAVQIALLGASSHPTISAADFVVA